MKAPEFNRKIMHPAVVPTTPEERLDLLRTCIDMNGSMLAGVRLFTEESTNATARRLGINPGTMRGCLNKTYGRRYESTRRSLELGLGLPPYSLDHLLDGDHGV